MKKILLALLSISSLTFGGSIIMFNDSPFKLKAEVIAANGTSQGSVELPPQHQLIWEDKGDYQATISKTPYTVIFICPSGKVYGIYDNVSPGALVTPQSATGDRYCEPQKKKQPHSTN